MKTLSKVSSIVALLILATIATCSFTGCNQVQNNASSALSSTESSTLQSVSESQVIAESSVISTIESEDSKETEQSIEPESSEEEVSLTDEEVQAIIDSLPEFTDDDFLSPNFSEYSVKCYARAKENGEYGTYEKGDLFKIIGKYSSISLVFYLDSPKIALIKTEFVDILPLDYTVKETDYFYSGAEDYDYDDE